MIVTYALCLGVFGFAYDLWLLIRPTCPEEDANAQFLIPYSVGTGILRTCTYLLPVWAFLLIFGRVEKAREGSVYSQTGASNDSMRSALLTEARSVDKTTTR